MNICCPFIRITDLLSYYMHVMAGLDAAQKEAVRADFDFLKGVKADPFPGCHTDTKFHCIGHPFQSKDYKEPDWAARLHHSIKDKLANNVKIYIPPIDITTTSQNYSKSTLRVCCTVLLFPCSTRFDIYQVSKNCRRACHVYKQ